MSANALSTTTASLTVFPWGNGDGSTTFNVPNLEGRTVVGRNNMSGAASPTLTSAYYTVDPNAANAKGGAQSTTIATGNLPAYTPSGSMTGSVTATVNDPGHTHGLTGLTTFVAPFGYPGVTSGGVAASLSLAGTGTTSSATTGITVTNNTSGMTFTGVAQGGASTPFSQIQPSISMDYIIKAFDVDSTIANLVVGVTVITGGSNNTVLYDNGGILGELEFATLADMYAGTAPLKIVAPAVAFPPEVVVTYGTTTTLDMSTFRDAVVTLTGNITTQTVSNVVVGKAGSITFIQDGTGGHTTVWSSTFKFMGGTAPTLTATAGAIDILTYQCRTTTFCYAAMMNDVK
jgi:microcystin-dependent protein